MRQRRWLELVKDYDCVINYHLGKVKVVTDALSPRVETKPTKLNDELQKFNLEIQPPGNF